MPVLLLNLLLIVEDGRDLGVMVAVFVGRFPVVQVDQHICQILVQSVFYVVISLTCCGVVRLRSLLVLLAMMSLISMSLSISLIRRIILLMGSMLVSISAIVLIHSTLFLIL